MDEKETVFHSPSPSEDYRSVVADSTSGTYRRISAEDLERPTEYMNREQPVINSATRQRLPDPPPPPVSVPEGRLLGGRMDLEGRYGVGDVDFDPKFTEAYANLDDIRDRDYQLASASDSPERRPGPGSMYKGVVNDTKKGKKCGCRISTCLITFLVLVLFLVNLAFGFFNFFNTYKEGEITNRLVSSSTSAELSIEQLGQRLKEMEKNFSMYRDTHNTKHDEIDVVIRDISSSIDTISSATTSPPKQRTVQVDINQNCTIDERTCTINPGLTPGANPRFGSCMTPVYEDDDNRTYIADIYCTLTNKEESMPRAATLSSNNGQWLCLCHGIEIPNQLFSILAISDCIMYVKSCPRVISVTIDDI